MNTVGLLHFILYVSCVILPLSSLAQDKPADTTYIPIVKVFNGIDKNLVGSFEYQYGLHYLIACAGTYGIVKGGIDWEWYKNAHNHPWIYNTGFISVAIGPIVSVAAPLGLYLYGRSNKSKELQRIGLALGQAAILGTVISSGLKAFTGRIPPNRKTEINNYSDGFRFGFFRGGIFNGWPSSHTTVAFAMATTLMELYPENSALKVYCLTYASFIGLGVSTNIHWFSDAFAGALIGYAIGEMVGSSYRNILNGDQEECAFSFSFTPTGLVFTYRF